MERSLWLDEALSEDRSEINSLNGDARADVCIVGGGFTGLWTALRLKEAEPSLDVMILEADICGGGASGRNGGFVLSFWAKYGSLAKLCGRQEAGRLAQESANAVAEIGRFCSAEAIDAHFRGDGWLWAATSKAQIGSWTNAIEQLAADGHEPFENLTPAEVARLAGSPTHLGGVLERTAATVQPARLARGLRRVALRRGVRIHEGTPMLALERARPARVRTPRGTVTAQSVVLATNAWGIRFPEIRQAIVVVSSDIVATQPIPDKLTKIGWTDGLAISDSRMLVNYYRLTRDGRLIFGKGGSGKRFPLGSRLGDRFNGASPNRTEVTQEMRRLYPALAQVPIAKSWHGPVDRGKYGVPVFGALDGQANIFYGVGYSGNGVGPTFLGGRILASLALGRKDEWSTCGLIQPLTRTFPGDPIRYVAGLAIRGAVAAKDRADDEGRRPGWLATRLAALAPAGLSPVKQRE
jgi:putative aminophosphonate oxidoreductase